MAINNRPRLNKSITGALPTIHGDKYRPSDKLIDTNQVLGKLGDLTELILSSPSIISGMVVSDGGSNTINITAGTALLYDAQVSSITPHNYDGTSLTPQTIEKYIVAASYPGASGIAITSGGGTKYVKATLSDTAILSRGYGSDPGTTYDFLVEDGIVITIDNVAPSVNQIVLATFPENTSPFTLSTTSRTQETVLNFPNNRTKVDVYANAAIAQYKVVYANGKNPSGESVGISPLSALTQVPIGIADTAVASGATGKILRYGPLQVTGFTGTVVGNAVYSDVSGNLTTTNTGVSVGYQMTTGSNAWVFFDFGGGGGGSSSGDSIKFPVAQTSHGLVVGNPIYYSASASGWVKAAASGNTSVGTGIVSAVTDTNNFDVTVYGKVTLTTGQWDALTGGSGGLTAGTTYFTSDVTAGSLVTVEPAISNPMLFGLSTTIAMVQPGFVAAESGAGNTRTEVLSTTTGSAGQTIALGGTVEGDAYLDVYVGGAILTTGDYSISGTDLIITDAYTAGLEIIVKIIRATTFNNDISQYVQRTTIALADDGTINLNSTAVFATISSGLYEIWDSSDPSIKAEILLKHGTPPVIDVFTDSGSVEGSDLDTFLCIYVSGNDVVIKNRLGSTKTFVVHRRI